MREPSMVKMGLVQVASQVLESTNRGKGGVSREVWASVGRYDDAFVEMLEKWEKDTRDGEGRMGKKGKGAGHLEDHSFASTLEGGQWDTGKMVRTFARLGLTPDYPVRKDNSDKASL
jgi:phosphatidylinositol-3,4,5-trisphosphate 3-phosphatase and dual-specificity protein phosphatase PTEN